MKASGFVPYSQSSYVVLWGRIFITYTAPGSVWPPGLSYLKVHGAREVNKLEQDYRDPLAYYLPERYACF